MLDLPPQVDLVPADFVSEDSACLRADGPPLVLPLLLLLLLLLLVAATEIDVWLLAATETDVLLCEPDSWRLRERRCRRLLWRRARCCSVFLANSVCS